MLTDIIVERWAGGTHLIVYARLSELRGVLSLIPRFDESLGFFWNGQVQAVHACNKLVSCSDVAHIRACSLDPVYRSVQVPEV